ncbi:MAG: ribonuclease HII [Candidatus Omnitrophica bacterium]|nr:ribonuclease HII [Candidatus Omnitrophota bacterium]
MLRYERKLKKRGFDLVIGVDEAGRGPLAGPVVAAAVLLKGYNFYNRIDDSKKLSPAKRRNAFFEIKNKSLYAIASVSHRQIDRINILQATILAMQKAILKLARQLGPAELRRAFIIIDGNMRIKLGLPYQSIVKGDAKSLSIAASSILAKVYRDALMERYHKVYPDYGFDKHKGYPTAEHRLILRKIGPSAIHRKSFLKCLEKI